MADEPPRLEQPSGGASKGSPLNTALISAVVAAVISGLIGMYIANAGFEYETRQSTTDRRVSVYGDFAAAAKSVAFNQIETSLVAADVPVLEELSPEELAQVEAGALDELRQLTPDDIAQLDRDVDALLGAFGRMAVAASSKAETKAARVVGVAVGLRIQAHEVFDQGVASREDVDALFDTLLRLLDEFVAFEVVARIELADLTTPEPPFPILR